MTKQPDPLESILIEKRLVDSATLQKAKAAQKNLASKGQNLDVGEVLVRANKISREDLKVAVSSLSKQPSDVLKSRSEVEDAVGVIMVQGADSRTGSSFVDQAYANQIQVAENARGEPLILVTTDFFHQYKNAVMTVRQKVLGAYATPGGKPVTPKIVKVTTDVLDLYRSSVSGGESDREQQSEYESEFEELIKRAYREKAVDLHFFRKADICTVRFRVWGSLRTYAEWNPEKADKIINVGFQSFGSGSKYSGWDRRVRQRVRIKIRFNQHITLDCRYEHAPGDDGAYHACIRILANDKREINKQIDLRKLGFTAAQHHALEAAVCEPSGLILLSGPTGSGKSTTLAGLIKYINRNNDVNVLTVESPIERELPAFQTSVSDDEDGDRNEFANAVKSMLRRDPDVAMVGELRDEMSAAAAATGVQTGHTLLSTVHAQSAIEIIERLASPAMNISPQSIASPSFISALVFQMLMPTLDDNSKVRLTRENIDKYMEPRQRERFLRLFPDFEKRTIFVRGQSDEYPEGVSGMTICAEVLVPNDVIRSHFRKMELTEALNHWRQLGAQEMSKPIDERVTGLTAADHAVAKTLKGMIDPRDLEEYFGHMDKLAEKAREIVRMRGAA